MVRYAEVLVEDFIIGDDKLVAKIITIVREIPRIEFYDMCSGKTNLVGMTFWYQNGFYHCDNDEPAIIKSNGDQEWWLDGFYHRDNNQPAIIKSNGDQEWWVNGVRAR